MIMIKMEELNTSLPDPNKQAFPVLPMHPAVLYDATPSPMIKAGDSGNYSLGRSAIELPQIYDQSHIGGEEILTNKDALKPTLPSVPSKQKGVSREGKSIQQTIEKVMKTQHGMKEFEFDDVGHDDLTQRVHAPNPLPYQVSKFRSSVQMKTVPLNRRHRDLLAGLNQQQTLPSPLAKCRILPVHTRPFLWGQESGASPTNSTKSQSPLSLPEKFHVEEQNIKKMRGYKRRYSVPQHRKGFNDLHVGGIAPNLMSRHDYRGEMSDLRNTVVPSDIQALYTGKGFKLPVSHSSNRKRAEWQANLKAEYAMPNSAPAMVTIPMATEGTNSDADSVTTRSHSVDGDKPQTKLTTQLTHLKHSKLKQTQKPAGKVDHHVQGQGLDKSLENSKEKSNVNRRGGQVRSEVKRERTIEKSTVRKIAKPKHTGVNKTAKYGGTLPQLQTESPTKEETNNDMEIMEQSTNNDRHEPSVEIPETPEVNLPEPPVEERPTTTRPESEMEIEMTPDEDIHKLRIPFTPTTPKAPSPNPLKSADLTLNISDERREELAAAFRKLDSDQDGHISKAELQTTLPDTLTRGQQTFIKEVYELVSSSTFFGMAEFVTVTCLCEEMLQLSGTLKAAYDELDMGILEELISQYVILFSTVDRQQTGSISIEALQEILTMALDKDLKIHTQLYQKILEDTDKEYSSAVTKVEYLTFLPYFFSCK